MGSKCESNFRKSWPETLLQLLTLTFDPFFNIKWGYFTTKEFISFSSPLLLILRREITTASVALFKTGIVFGDRLKV